MPGFRDDFGGTDLDLDVWVPHYLPAWSSRAATAASYEVRDSRLTLRIPPDHRLWCPEVHPTPLRVCGIMSGVTKSAFGADGEETWSIVTKEGDRTLSEITGRNRRAK